MVRASFLIMSIFSVFLPNAFSVANPSVTSSELVQHIEEGIPQVDEFNFIRKEAEAHGFRAWLFGGTASGYGRYSKLELLKIKGDPRFQKSDRFDHHFTNIYRSSQDADIVIDGTPAQAAALEASLAEKYPHLKGKKSVWEVRLLKERIKDKLPLLGDPSFKNQHTDSHSLGMIELTKPPAEESSVKDLRHWNSENSDFLHDLVNDSIHYYFSDLHKTTERALLGKNPEIISVTRFLIKVNQGDLRISPEDDKVIQKISDAFDPKGSEMQNGYVRKWFEEDGNGKKLIESAVNIEHATAILDHYGLRKKFAAIFDTPHEKGSLSWWMSKEPLRSFKIGGGSGETAKSLGIGVISHVTSSFSAYESIIWAPSGDPNVFISRRGVVGEQAVYGDGFYASQGTRAGKQGGLTIRFNLHPDAREGTDFKRVGPHLLILNKDAIRVIPESLRMDPVSYFTMLFSGEDIDSTDQGIHERATRRVETELSKLSKEDWKIILENAQIALKQGRKIDFPLSALNLIGKSSSRFPEGRTLLNLSMSNLLKNDPVRIHDLLGRENFKDNPAAIEFVTSHSEDFFKMSFMDSGADRLIHSVFALDDDEIRKRLIDQVVQRGDGVAVSTLTSAWMGKDYERMPPTEVQLKKILSSKDKISAYHNVGEIISKRPEWRNHPELMEESILNGHSWPMTLIQQSQWADQPEYASIIATCDAKGYYEAPPCLREALKRKRGKTRRFLQCIANIF